MPTDDTNSAGPLEESVGKTGAPPAEVRQPVDVVAPGGVAMEWAAADRTLWRVHVLPDRLVLDGAPGKIDLPKDRWKTDLYVAPHGDAFVVRVETFQLSVGFIVTAAQVEPLLRHVALPAAPQQDATPEPSTTNALLHWPRVSPLAIWAVICASLSFLPVVGILPAIAAAVLIGIHRKRVRRAAAWGHSRLICTVAALLIGSGLLVSALGTWGLIDNVARARATDIQPQFERPRGGPSSTQSRNLSQFLVWHGLPARDCTGKMLVPHHDGIVSPGATGGLPTSGPSEPIRVHHAGLLDEDHNWGLIAAALFVMLLSLTVHEAAHAISAWWLGDDFAHRLGRVTLNPLAHIDPIGTVLLPLILFLANSGVFGWAKPVPVRLDCVPRPRRAHILIALAGPGSNLLIASLSLMLLLGIGCTLGRFFPEATLENLTEPNFHSSVSAAGFLFAPIVGPLCTILKLSFLINIMLACFNLIPIPPLDGSWVLENLFPFTLGPIYQRLRPMSFLLFLGLLYSNVLDQLLTPVWYAVDFGFALLALCTIY